ncbi:MAG TPA: site-2 protease family protein [Candidatus Saccharimonadales bacterium]|nr:site-2 protease family protein [Candidatus Saccharimonadales bacterium]
MDSLTQELLIVLPVLLVSMSLHEMMHALVSYWLGDDLAYLQGRISINPIKHIDPVMTLALPLLLVLSHSPVLFGAAKPVQVNFNRVRYGEYGAAIVGMVGPLTNLVLAILAAIVLRVVNPTSTVFYDILGYTVIVNIGFFVFNTIPWPPLDGSRLLYAFAPRPLQEIMESIERMGLAGLVIFILIFYQFIGPLVTTVVDKLVSGLAPGLL